jgi:hypothetical protein
MINSDDSILGHITLVYSSEPATVEGHTAVDTSDRPVMKVSGMVFDKSETNDPALTSRAQEILNKQVPMLSSCFQRLWNSDTPIATQLSEPVTDEFQSPIEPESPWVRTSFRQRAIVVLIAILFLSLAINVVLAFQISRISGKLARENAMYLELQTQNNQLMKANDALTSRLHVLGY